MCIRDSYYSSLSWRFSWKATAIVFGALIVVLMLLFNPDRFPFQMSAGNLFVLGAVAGSLLSFVLFNGALAKWDIYAPKPYVRDALIRILAPLVLAMFSWWLDEQTPESFSDLARIIFDVILVLAVIVFIVKFFRWLSYEAE